MLHVAVPRLNAFLDTTTNNGDVLVIIIGNDIAFPHRRKLTFGVSKLDDWVICPGFHIRALYVADLIAAAIPRATA